MTTGTLILYVPFAYPFPSKIKMAAKLMFAHPLHENFILPFTFADVLSDLL
jgi:hypothetical protein